MERIKIVRIIARLNIGGPALHAILLTVGINKNRFDSLLVCGSVSKDEGDMSYYASERNVKPIFIPELKREINFRYDFTAFKKIFNIIKTEEPQIIHTHTAKAGTLGRLAAILYNFLNLFNHKRVKLVHTFHGHIFEGYFSKSKTKLFILIEKFLSCFTAKIITVSDSLKNELIALGVSKGDKIKVIPLGFDLCSFLTIPETNDTILNIGIVGRLVPIKNHRLFLEAAAKVISDNPRMKLRFDVIGDGELRQDLEAYSRKLNISSQVNFLGWQKDLDKIYLGLDVVALTSNNEGTPVSLIEAMASGRIVVATDVGGVRDLLGSEIEAPIRPNEKFKVLERGIIADSGDSESFAKALNFILEHGDTIKKIKVEARNFVKKRFREERLISDIETLYDSLMAPCYD
jgi:glycosyltransferase involved in cell wall biosynthesis